MDLRYAARTIAIARIAIGVVMLLVPRRAGRMWLGAVDGAVAVAVRALGARDLALGAGAFRSLGSGGPAQAWVIAGAVADGADAIATLAGYRSLPRRRRFAVLLVAGLSSAISWRASSDVDAGRRPGS